LSGYNVPEALMAEIQHLQNMLAQQDPNSPLGEALRRRLVNVIERLLEVAPGIDVQGLFEGAQ
jgi:hypothetical protein